MGIQGIPGCKINIFCNILDYLLGLLAYFEILQSYYAPLSYWRDLYSTFRYNIYLDHSEFLPYINNEKHHDKYDEYKDRFSWLNRLELVMFENDKTIVPKESEFFEEIKSGG